MHIELEPRDIFRYGSRDFPLGLSVRVYDYRGGTDPSATAQVKLVGRRALIYSVQGKAFYTAIHEFAAEALKWRVDTLEGYATEAHARLLRRVFGRDRVEIESRGTMAGRPMPWVVVHINREVKQ